MLPDLCAPKQALPEPFDCQNCLLGSVGVQRALTVIIMVEFDVIIGEVVVRGQTYSILRPASILKEKKA